MEDQHSRSEALLGREALEHLRNCRVAVFGIGGVGGFVCEALVRSGIGAFTLVDHDKVALSNINRQVIADHKSLGRYKVDVMKERMEDIAPYSDIRTHRTFFLPDEPEDVRIDDCDYVVDAVDTVSAKIGIIMMAKSLDIPVISAMGAGNKLDPSRLRAGDIYDTRVCPLCRVMRRELKKRGIESLKTVWSDEPPVPVTVSEEESDSAPAPASVIFVPSVMGVMIAREVVSDLLKKEKRS